MNTSLKSKWLVDAGLFAIFLATFFVEFTGIALHQWLGIAVGAVIAYHLATHWAWIKSVTKRIFGKTSGRSRLYYWIDAALLGGIVTIIVTGLVISTWLNLPLEAYTTWRTIHVGASLLTLLLTVVKLGLHWRWIVSVAKSIFTRPGAQPQTAITTAIPVTRLVSRREFNRVMTVVGVSSAVALAQGIKSLSQQNETVSTTSNATTATTVPVATLSSVSESASNNSQASLCPRGCSFPGRCRRYTDANNNGRCDLGESA